MVEYPAARRPTAQQARRAWLNVPHGEKDEAKPLGARWDPTAKR